VRAFRRSIPRESARRSTPPSDSGQVTPAEAKLLLQTVLSAGPTPPFITMANALRAWAEFPDEYAKLRAEPKKGPRRVRRVAALGQPQPHGRPHHHARGRESTTTSSRQAPAAG
jgi:hypothetical protein